MNKKLCIALSVLAFNIAPAASANLYMKGNVALPIRDELRGDISGKIEGFNPFVMATLGKQLNKEFAVELSGMFKERKTQPKNTSTTILLRSYSALINLLGYPNVFKDECFRPFVGVGVGYSYNKNGTSTSTPAGTLTVDDATATHNLIGQVFLGADFKLTNNVMLTSDIRWIYLNKFLIASGAAKYTSYLDSIAITLGAKINL